jgi:hypothetical protein
MSSEKNSIFLTGLWEKTDGRGAPMLSGNIGPWARFLVFKNINKKQASNPDWNLCVVPNEQRPIDEGKTDPLIKRFEELYEPEMEEDNHGNR